MFHAHKTEFAEKGWMGIFKVIENSQDDKNETELSSNSSINPNNVPVSGNQSYVLSDSSQNVGKHIDIENSKTAHNYSSYRISNDLFHGSNSQQHTNSPNAIISSYQDGASSSQGATI